MRKKVTKAIFPVAGLGTRFLPATKSVPKEIMTLVDRPLIQYAIDEARAAGKPMRYNGMWRDRDPSEAPAGIDPVVRLKAPQEGETTIVDAVQGEVTVQNNQLDDFVLLRFTPDRLELVSLGHGIAAEPKAWRPAVLELPVESSDEESPPSQPR